MNEKNREQIKEMALLAMFTAIIFVLAMTPLGFIPLLAINATTIHIPVIIGSILLGPKKGAVLGFMFGLSSLFVNSFRPNPMISFVFSPFQPLPGTDSGSVLALIVCFVPRILVGVVPWFVYTGLVKLVGQKLKVTCLAIAGVVGSMTNTILVMHLIFFLFREPFAAAPGRDLAIDAVYGVILGIIAGNGIPEAIAAGVLVCAISIQLLELKFGGVGNNA